MYKFAVALYLSFLSKNIALSISLSFHKNSLMVACCTFSKFKIRTLTPSRFKNQTNDIFKLLGHNCNINKGFLNKKLLLSIIAVLSWNSLNISGKHYRWNSSCWKLEKYLVGWLCVYSGPIIKLLFHTKFGDLLHGTFSRSLPNYGLSYFR